MKILLINQGNTDNIGDQLIDRLMTDLLQEGNLIDHMTYSGKRFHKSVSSQQGKKGRSGKKNQLKRSFLFLPLMVRRCLKRIQENINHNRYDIAIIGGGELIKSKHPFFAYLISWIYYFLHTSTKVCIFGISCDRNFSLPERIVLKKFLEKVQFINCRDVQTRDYLLNSIRVNASFSPDVVNLYHRLYPLDIHKEDTAFFSVYNYDKLPCKTEYGSREKYYQEIWSKWLSKVEQEQGLKVYFGATNTEDADETNRFCIWAHRSERIDYSKDLQVDNVVRKIASARAVVTGRMHAMILARQFGTTVFPFAFKDKIKDYVQTWIAGDGYSDADIYQMIQKEIRQVQDL